jgi:hypothetical protein
MDAEEKRRKKTEYQRIWRARQQNKGAEPVISKPELEVNLDDINPLKYKPKRAKAVPLKQNTINTYVSKLRAFHRRMTGLDLSEDIVNAINGNEYDKKAVQDEFKYLYNKTDYIIEKELKAIPNICKVFTKITGFVKLIKILTPIKRNIEMAEGVKRNESTIKEDDMINFDKQEILKNANDKLTEDYDKIMYLLMTLIPTRRLDDYRNMTYGKSDGNYYDDEYMYIKDTNTKNKKSITIKIPNEIIDILPHTGYILGYEYSQSALSVKFSSVMEKVYKKKIGASDLRRMYLTTINRSGASFLERKEVADAVGNSIVEGIKYSLKVHQVPQPQQVQDEEQS